jgi:hypothetical protein
MTTAIAVAAVLAFSFALGSLIRQVDGATLRRWRLSRRWDVSRLAREFITAADEPLATLRGLMHMINAWERGARKPSERYWLLYLRIFPEYATGETAIDGAQEDVPQEDEVLAGKQLGTTEINPMQATTLSSARSADPREIRALAATVRALEQQIAGISRRLDELSRGEHGEGQPRERSQRRKKTNSKYWRSSWTPLYNALLPSL